MSDWSGVSELLKTSWHWHYSIIDADDRANIISRVH